MGIVQRIYLKIQNIVRVGFIYLFMKYTLHRNIKISKKFSAKKGFSVVVGKNAKLNIGEGVFFNNRCSVNCLNSIEIGDNTIFGENVQLNDSNHQFKLSKIPFKEQEYSYGTIEIGNNCWIGSNVIILKNVSIGNNVVIAANTVVTKDIPENTLVYNKIELVKKSLE